MSAAAIRSESHDPDGALRRLLDRLLDDRLVDDDRALGAAVRKEARRLGMDPRPCPATEVVEDDGDVGLRRFLAAVREAAFDAAAIHDEFAEELQRLALADPLHPAPDDAILHIPADRLTWCANQWFARRDDLAQYLPPGAPIPDAGRASWPPVKLAEMANALRASGMEPSEIRPIVARYREHLRVRWGISEGKCA